MSEFKVTNPISISIFSIPSLVQKDIDRREHNKLHMRKYRARLSKEKKEIVKLYDRNRRRDERYEKLEKSPSYNQIIYRSK